MDLLPCPFCGGEAILVPDDGWFLVRCYSLGKCFAENGGETEAKAIAAWNRRAATLSALTAERDALDKDRRDAAAIIQMIGDRISAVLRETQEDTPAMNALSRGLTEMVQFRAHRDWTLPHREERARAALATGWK